MYEVIQNPHLHQNRNMIHMAFGHDANIQKITENIRKLKHDKIKIPRLKDPFDRSPMEAFLVVGTNKVHLSTGFHRQGISNEHCGGILIHEAAHALFNTKDEHTVGRNGERLTGCMSPSCRHWLSCMISNGIHQIYVIRTSKRLSGIIHISCT